MDLTLRFICRRFFGLEFGFFDDDLQDDEAERNSTKVDMLFVRSSEEQLGSQIFSVYRKQHEGGETDTVKESIGADLG